MFRPMQLEDFRFNLPDELIAKFPISPRDHSKLLVVDRKTKTIEHRHFFDLPEYLKPKDLLVLNNTKVIPARLFGKNANGKNFEVFLLKSLGVEKLSWECLVRPGKKAKGGMTVFFEDGVQGYIQSTPRQIFEILFTVPPKTDFMTWLFKAGNSPLPPYLKRKAEPQDKTTYQTVYAKEAGSVAAPTAGLHFTENLLSILNKKGVETSEVTLHVGYGTFSPIRTENILDHKMHSEDYEVSEQTIGLLRRTKDNRGRIFAVGTTSLRTQESYPMMGPQSSTRIYITPGYQFQMIDGLITNFHLPESSLYVLVCALLGIEFCRHVYTEAIKNNYRFYSYGDAMLIL